MTTYNSISKYRVASHELVRRAKGNGPGPGWVPVSAMVVRKGFLATYRAHLAVSGAATLVGGGAIAGALFAPTVGFAAPVSALGLVWVALGVIAVLTASVALPLFWYGRYTRMNLS